MDSGIKIRPPQSRAKTITTSQEADLFIVVHAILDEAVIRRTVGSEAIMRKQLERLLQVGSLPNVRLQIVPFGAGAHPGMLGSFVVMDFANPFDASLVYTDGIAGDAFLEGADAVAHYTAMFDIIAESALSEAQSKKLIQGTASAFQGDRDGTKRLAEEH